MRERPHLFQSDILFQEMDRPHLFKKYTQFQRGLRPHLEQRCNSFLIVSGGLFPNVCTYFQGILNLTNWIGRTYFIGHYIKTK